jgi:ABC-type antimicrobial peptide transport system permease subunit
VYLPLAQRAVMPQTSVLVRSDPMRPLPPSELSAAIRQIDRELPVFSATTLREQVRNRIDRQRAIAFLLVTFGAIGLLVAAIGLYGVIAYTVWQRRREIAIRLAVGGTPANVLRMVIRQGLHLAAAGVGVGAVLGIPANMLIASSVFGVRAGTVTAFGGSAVLLTLVVLAGSWLPARAASRIDPGLALGDE